MERTCRSDARDVRDLRADLVPVFKRDRATGRVRDSGKVEHRVRGATEGHVESHTVMDGRRIDDIECLDVLLNQFHDLHARMLREAHALGIDSRDGAIARKRDAEAFGEASDRVRREHARTATAGRTGGFFEELEIGFIHRACGHLTDRVEERVQVSLIAALIFACKHRTARNENGRDVQATRRDEHTGNNLIAAGDEHHRVELMALDRTLDRVGNDLAARERIAHAFVVHGDAIANADRGHLHWRAPCHAHACLHRISDGLQVNMTGDDLVL